MHNNQSRFQVSFLVGLRRVYYIDIFGYVEAIGGSIPLSNLVYYIIGFGLVWFCLLTQLGEVEF